jgi:hypothetical protein
MTDRNAILEALTAKMEEIWNDDLSFEDQAAAVLELVGPKPLVWEAAHKNRWECTAYFVEHYTWPHPLPAQYRLHLVDGTWEGDVLGNYPTLEAAQAAAQAHATAAHWANTKIGGE